jgi:hypothetical protein
MAAFSSFGLQSLHFCASVSQIPLSIIRYGSRNARFSPQNLSNANISYLFRGFPLKTAEKNEGCGDIQEAKGQEQGRDCHSIADKRSRE